MPHKLVFACQLRNGFDGHRVHVHYFGPTIDKSGDLRWKLGAFTYNQALLSFNFEENGIAKIQAWIHASDCRAERRDTIQFAAAVELACAVCE